MNDMPKSESATETANPLKQLERFGQSPWLDFIQRSFLFDGRMQALLERDGLKGMTSNPSIFEKAMGHGTDYDGGFKHLADAADHDAQGIYEATPLTSATATSAWRCRPTSRCAPTRRWPRRAGCGRRSTGPT